MTSSMLRRQLKNLVQNYSEAEVKVREATSNDPWGPSSSQMADISDLTYNVVACNEIMTMLWKRLKDDRNWRHIHKSLTLLEYLLKTGDDRVLLKMKDNIYIVKALTEYRFVEKDGKDQGANVREKAKVVLVLMEDDEKLKVEREFAMKTREKTSKSSAASSTETVKDPNYKPCYVAGASGLPSLDNIPSVADLTASFAARKEERLKQEAEKKEADRRAKLSEDELQWEDAGKGNNIKVNAWAGDKAEEEEAETDAWGGPKEPKEATDPWGTPARPDTAAASSDSWGAPSKTDEDPFVAPKKGEDPFAAPEKESISFSASKDDPFNAPKDVPSPFSAPRDRDKEDPFAAPKDKPDPFSSTSNDPFNAPKDPFNAPKDDPFNAPKDDPFNAPKDDPFSAPKDDPFSAPKDDPFNAPKDDPFNAPKDDPFNAPKDYPFNAPKDDPFNAPKDDPFKAPKEDPFNAPKDDPFNAPKDIPFNSSKDDPFNASKDDPFNTQKDDPFNTPQDDPFTTPTSPPKEDPFSAPFTKDDPFAEPTTPPKDVPFSAPSTKDDAFSATALPKEDPFAVPSSPSKRDASDPFNALPVSSAQGSGVWGASGTSPPATGSDPWGNGTSASSATDNSDPFGDASKPDNDPWGAPAPVSTNDAWGSPALPPDSSPSSDPFGDEASKKGDPWGAQSNAPSNGTGKPTTREEDKYTKTASFLGSVGASLVDLDNLFSSKTKPKQFPLVNSLVTQPSDSGAFKARAHFPETTAPHRSHFGSMFLPSFHATTPTLGADSLPRETPLFHLLSHTVVSSHSGINMPQVAPPSSGTVIGPVGARPPVGFTMNPLCEGAGMGQSGSLTGNPFADPLPVGTGMGQLSYFGGNCQVGVGSSLQAEGGAPFHPQWLSGFSKTVNKNNNPFLP